VRQVIVTNIVSLDGFYSATDGNPLVLNMDAAFDAHNRVHIEAAGTVLLGRSSFEGFSSYWPHVADAPEDPVNRALSEDNRATSRAYNAVEKVVVSDRYVVPEDNPWQGTTRVVSRSDVAGWLTAARGGHGGDILVFGSRIMWNALLAQGLVDELHLVVSPNALGDGVPLFDAPVSLSLQEARRLEDSDNALLRYAVHG
jgi:dihydrofolate reductase